MRNIFKLLIVVTLIQPNVLLAGKEETNLETYKEFVTQVGNEIIKILVNKDKPIDARKEEFRRVLKRDFDIKGIGKFVLGAYWRRGTEAQKEEYLTLFENALVNNYAAQFDNYNNEKLNVESARQSKDGGIIVKSAVVRPAGGEPLNVDWKIFETKKNGMKVLDLIVNGVSMSITQRSEYRGIIQENGGSIEGLLEAMRHSKPAKKA